jgi:hypothetical protein
MADEAKIGTNWQDDELDAIVADYFSMLAADLSGQPYMLFFLIPRGNFSELAGF